MKFLKIYNRLILEQTEDQNIKKMHDIYIKVMDDEDIAEQKWQKALSRKRLCICVKDQKTKLIKISSFNKNPDRYIKYAQQFIQESQDEDLDEKDVDKVLSTAKQKITNIEAQIKQKKIEPTKAVSELKQVYNQVKKENPEAAEQIKNKIQKDIKIISKKTTTTTQDGKSVTTTKTNYTISGDLKKNIIELANRIIRRSKNKEYIQIFKKYSAKFNSDRKANSDLFYASSIYHMLKANKYDRRKLPEIRLNLQGLCASESGKELINQLVAILEKQIEDQKKEPKPKLSGNFF